MIAWGPLPPDGESECAEVGHVGAGKPASEAAHSCSSSAVRWQDGASDGDLPWKRAHFGGGGEAQPARRRLRRSGSSGGDCETLATPSPALAGPRLAEPARGAWTAARGSLDAGRMPHPVKAFFSQFPGSRSTQHPRPGHLAVVDLEDTTIVQAAAARPPPARTVRSAVEAACATAASSSSEGLLPGAGGACAPAGTAAAPTGVLALLGALVRPDSASHALGGYSRPSGDEAGACGQAGQGVARAEAKRQQRSSGGPAQEGTGRQRRKRRYAEADRAAAPPLIAKLMEAADFRSNVTGGAEAWKRIMQEARALASPEQRARLGDVMQAFKSNTPGIHGCKLDNLIREWS
mmetsp:Transcript_17711/g.41472  ORF Transcript_17711/g.41472 Transcript_17711/m.41472 type:complete len:349 (+) Transcript_17711:147-1193(+)